MEQEELRRYLGIQIKAFQDWLWCFGVDTGINLRDYFNETELWHIWVNRHASEFHDRYLGDGTKGESKNST